MVNVGIIGVGYWGANLVRTFNELEGAAITAVADTRPGRLHFVEKRYPHVRTVSSHLELLSDPTIDAIIVSTPVPTHYDVARQVLEAGKHCFVEKPLAYSHKDATELCNLAERLDLRLAVGHVYQFSPAVTWLAQTLASGALGKVFHIDSVRINLGPPHSEVDVVWDLAPHDLSILIHLMRAAGISTQVKKLTVLGKTYTREALIDLVHVYLEFEEGMTAHVHVSWVTSNKVRLMQISAEKGTVVFDDMMPVEKLKVFSEGVDTRKNADASHAAELTYRPGDIYIPTLARQEPLSLECKHFVDCITSGETPINGPSIGAEVVQLLEQISEAIRSK